MTNDVSWATYFLHITRKRPREKEKRRYGKVRMSESSSRKVISRKKVSGTEREGGGGVMQQQVGLECVRLFFFPPSLSLCLSNSPYFKDQVQLDRNHFSWLPARKFTVVCQKTKIEKNTITTASILGEMEASTEKKKEMLTSIFLLLLLLLISCLDVDEHGTSCLH